MRNSLSNWNTSSLEWSAIDLWNKRSFLKKCLHLNVWQGPKSTPDFPIGGLNLWGLFATLVGKCLRHNSHMMKNYSEILHHVLLSLTDVQFLFSAVFLCQSFRDGRWASWCIRVHRVNSEIYWLMVTKLVKTEKFPFCSYFPLLKHMGPHLSLFFCSSPTALLMIRCLNYNNIKLTSQEKDATHTSPIDFLM